MQSDDTLTGARLVEAGALCCRRTCSRFGSALRRR